MSLLDVSWKSAIAAALLALTVPAAVPAFAQQVRYYDSRGNSLGTATASPGGQATFRDSRGNTTGTASRDSQGTVTFRDSRGNVTGRASGGRR